MSEERIPSFPPGLNGENQEAINLGYTPDSKGNFTTRKERWSYYSHSIGGFIFNTAFGAALLMPFLTDIGISAIAISVILLITKIWDAINDPIGGVIIERANFKGGKYLPWLKWGTFLLPALLTLFFLVSPGWNEPMKIVYILIFYVLIEGVFTFVDAPTFGLSLSMTTNVQERVKVYSTAGFFAGIGALLATLMFTIFHETLHLPYWSLGIIFGVSFLCFSIFLPFNGKERFVIKNEDTPTLKQMVRSIVKNKYLLIYYLCLIICFGTSTIAGIVVYLARHVLNDSTQVIWLTLATMAPVFVVAFLIPILTKKIDKFKLFIVFNVGTVLTSILAFLVGYDNVVLFYLMTILRGFFFSGISLMAYTFTGDLVEYGHFVHHERAEGVAFSFQTFAAKAISGLQTFLGGILLAAFGFAEGEGAEQSARAIQGIWLQFTIFPIIGGVIGITLFIIFYHLRDRDVQVMAKANHNLITREEALAQLSQKYD